MKVSPREDYKLKLEEAFNKHANFQYFINSP